MARAKGIPALELYRLAQKKKRKLVLCGHSLGGAVRISQLFGKICYSVYCCMKIVSYFVLAGCSIGYSCNFKGYFCFIFFKRK